MAPFRVVNVVKVVNVVNVVNVDPLKVVGLVIVERPPLLDLRTASLGSPKAIIQISIALKKQPEINHSVDANKPLLMTCTLTC